MVDVVDARERERLLIRYDLLDDLQELLDLPFVHVSFVRKLGEVEVEARVESRPPRLCVSRSCVYVVLVAREVFEGVRDVNRLLSGLRMIFDFDAVDRRTGWSRGNGRHAGLCRCRCCEVYWFRFLCAV